MKALYDARITTKFHIDSRYSHGFVRFPDLPGLKTQYDDSDYYSSGKYYSDRDNADVAMHAIAHMFSVKKNVVLRDEFDMPILLEGDVFDHPRFNNRDHIVTSPVISFNFDNEAYIVAQTKSGSVYKVVFRFPIENYCRRYRGDNTEYYNKAFKEV